MEAEPYSPRALRTAYRLSGLDLRSLCRRAEVTRHELVDVLRGREAARVEVLASVALELGLRLMLEPAPAASREKGPILTVVDEVCDALAAGQAPRARRR